MKGKGQWKRKKTSSSGDEISSTLKQRKQRGQITPSNGSEIDKVPIGGNKVNKNNSKYNSKDNYKDNYSKRQNKDTDFLHISGGPSGDEKLTHLSNKM